MAVNHDTHSFHAFSQDLSATHTPVGVPRGVVVLIAQGGNATADAVVGVTYGGVPMARVRRAQDLTGAADLGASYLYFLGSGIPSGPQTLAIDINTVTVTLVAWCVTMTASGDTSVAAHNGSGTTAANPSVVLATDADFDGIVYAALYSGVEAPASATPAAGYTALSGSSAAGHDFGGASSVAEVGAKSGANVTAGWTVISEDVALVAAAIAGEESTVTIVEPAAIASDEATGAPTVRSNVTVEPGGASSEEDLGEPHVRMAVAAGDIASGEAMGEPRIQVGVQPDAIGPGEAGQPTVGMAVAPVGIGSAEAVGDPVVAPSVVLTWGAVTGTTAGELLRVAYTLSAPATVEATLTLADNRALPMSGQPLEVLLPADTPAGNATVTALVDGVTYTLTVALTGTIVTPDPTTPVPRRTPSPPARAPRDPQRTTRRVVVPIVVRTTTRVRGRVQGASTGADVAPPRLKLAIALRTQTSVELVSSRSTTRRRVASRSAIPAPRTSSDVARHDGENVEALIVLLA